MYSKWTIFALSASLSVIGCSTKSASRHDMELLTGNPWKYEKAGFGSDDEGIFDALDPRIAGCEKDNMITFRKDGTGSSDALPFLWAFQNNDSTIYFQDQYYKVRTLSRHRLEIYADQKLGKVSTRYTIVFKH
jgi:hypothetical protein